METVIAFFYAINQPKDMSIFACHAKLLLSFFFFS